jgi:hypothetical protein
LLAGSQQPAAVEMLRVARVTRSAGTQVTVLRWSDRTRTRALLVAGSQFRSAVGSAQRYNPYSCLR